MSGKRRIVCWQGWKLELPHRWHPVKLEGDHTAGHALFADTLRPRLGLRWQAVRRKSDPAIAVQKAMRTEVGQLAAAEARPYSFGAATSCDPAPSLRYAEGPDRSAHPSGPSDYLSTDMEVLQSPESTSVWQYSLLYLEPEPSGRDVFSAYSPSSSRLLQIVYHAHRRENLFAYSILPTLADVALDRAAQWSIFDLNCVIPAGMTLKSQHLNAGDLGLTFADRFNEVTVRQIAVAQLALQRQSLDGWIADQQKLSRRYHFPTGAVCDISVAMNHHAQPARIGRMERRLRYALMWNQPKTYTTIAAHIADRDRLILLHGTDESLLRVIAESVGSL